MIAKDLIEMKLTRSELVDLVVEGLIADIQKQEAEHEKLKPEEPKFTAEELSLQDLRFTISTGYKGNLYVSFDDDDERALKTAPKAWKEWKAKYERWEKDGEVFRTKLYELRKGKQRAKLEVIRSSLEMSPEGKQLLELVETFKVKLTTKLLKGGG